MTEVYKESDVLNVPQVGVSNQLSFEPVNATSSLNISKVFSKLHKNVLRDIKRLISSGSFSERNFAPVEFIDNKGESRPMYVMDEKLTTVLIMRFTGQEALKWQIAYYDEFKRMRETLSKPKQEEVIPRFHYDMLAEQHKELMWYYRSWYKKNFKAYPTSNQEAEFVMSINEFCLGEVTDTRRYLTYKGGIRIMAGYQILINQFKKGYRDLNKFRTVFIDSYGETNPLELLSREGVYLPPNVLSLEA
jgi:Rha family phage regulatory protein